MNKARYFMGSGSLPPKNDIYGDYIKRAYKCRKLILEKDADARAIFDYL